jgi:hypothetical protein
MGKFEVGQTYDAHDVHVEIVSRTPRKITVDQDGERKTYRIRQHNYREMFDTDAGYMIEGWELGFRVCIYAQ